ncbi:translation initiation factor IF-2 N-terminal domain-containing protein [Corynebacterium sp.]|uniref:translation initiation factor IF-2 N-terminal domain-containing protein n=1 Tax=Corynebacterium sp. TaxID=1720 RepID=UPI002649BD5A|nr:translation initiation factor IF-2 N-terminal domain-containing protein [Corynebacterium sp.]MDN6136893.1 translation initiation factor IF-2 N-terminal domain-containing protein [Corynebacterium sp.]MDN6737603.1 translation initiation factor IF-2 N-terminal domain-containing protein [Corynebacterium sp.]
MATADEKLNEQLAGAAALAEQIDRQQLAEKTRVYTLAKQLGISSKVLLEQLGTIGISKKAQSALSTAEVTQLLDSLQSAQPEAPSKEPAPKKAAKKSAKTTKKAIKATKKTASKATKKATKKSTPAPEEPVAEDLATEASAAEAVEEPAPQAQEQAEDPATTTRKRSRTRRVVKRAAAPEPTASDAAQPSSQDAEPSEAENAADSAEEGSGDSDKLRYRVQKNVENEIYQIEGKVESELAAVALEALSETHSDDETEGTENDENTDNTDDVVADAPVEESAVEESATAAQDTETAAKEDDVLAAYAPIFMPPQPVKASETTTRAAASKDVEDFADDADGHEEESSDATSTRRRRGRRGTSRGRGKEVVVEPEAEKSNDVEIIDEPRGIKGSTRIESQRRRRAEMRSKDRENRHVVTQAEFLARREAVERTMVVRERERHDGHGNITQVGVLEDGMLVEHFVTDETNTSIIGNIYLGRVQNVLPSMEAAFIDIGTGRNGVLYAGEVNWRQAGLGGRARKIEQAMKSGDQVLVQVAKDPVGHKGPRLTTQISLPGRFLVYVPGGRNAGISRKLPAPERKRLREILDKVVPEQGGAIIRTAAENVAEEAIAADVNRLHDTWNEIQEAAEKEKASKGSEPVALYEEPQMLVKVVRDLFNEDFDRLIVDGARPYDVVSSYVNRLAPELADRVSRYDRADNAGIDAFETYRIDEQLQKALSRKVWLPSGGTLVIDRTEAMTVVDVNTGKFTGTGGNLEETVTKNNLEAAEEVVRQMRLRDLGGMIVVDFIDMVLPENQELVLRRLKEALGRDRTRHQVSEVTSLGLVQMTRKRLGSGLLETFSTECEACQGRGLILHEDPVEEGPIEAHDPRHDHHGESRRGHKKHRDRHELAGEQDQSEDASDDSKQERADHGQRGGHTSRKQSRRGASRRGASQRGPASRGTTKGAASRGDDSNLDELIAGIVVDSSAAKDKSEKSDNRGGSVTDIESIAYAATERAEALDDVGEFSSYVAEEAGQKTYAEALKEFEESPRRKRKTRGNSRSDYPPRPEDFQAPQVAEKPRDDEQPASGMETKKDSKRRRVRASNRKPASASQPTEVGASEAAEKQSSQQRESSRGEKKRAQVEAVTRGRRRAVRRAPQSRNVAKDASAAKASARVQDGASQSAEPQIQRKRTDDGMEVTTVRRGRKRAVRRVAVRAASEGQNTQPSASQQSVAQEPKAQTRKAPEAEETRGQKSRGRTRRRVARRTNS